MSTVRKTLNALTFAFGAGLVCTALLQREPDAFAQAPAGSAKAASAAASGSAKTAGATTAAAAKGGPVTAAPAGTAATAGPAVPVPTAEAKPGGMDGATYSVRLRALEGRVDELKDQIRRSHTRLSLLSDAILSGGVAGSRCEVVFRNEMSSAFRLTKALFVMDGTVQYNKQDETGTLADQREIPIFNGPVPPGDHTVQVVLNFQGNGYGAFTYLKGYKFEVKSAHAFTAVEGKTLVLTSTALEKGGVTTPLEQRPAIEWNERMTALTAGGPQPAAAPAAPAK